MTTTELTFVEDHANMLREIMVRDLEDENDFATLAITGEELRLAIVLDERAPADTVAILADYDRLLPTLRALVPLDLEVDLEVALDALGVFDDEDPIIRVDEVLMVAAAGARAGTLRDSFVVGLGRRARECAHEVAPTLSPYSWSEAVDRLAVLGPDVRFLGLYDWLEELAALSAEYGAMRALVEKMAQ
jgi:hypothetical protein